MRNSRAVPGVRASDDSSAAEELCNRYRAIVEAFDGFIYICSPDYRIEFLNDNFIRRIGRDATGEFCYEALHDRKTMCPWCVNERVFQGETVRWEVQSPKDQRWLYVVNTPFRHADGSISKQAVIQDITERKLETDLREREEQLRTMANAIPNIAFSSDAAGKIDYLNDWGYQYGGFPRGDLSLNDALLQTIHADDVESVLQAWRRCVATGEVFEHEHRIRRASDGSYRWHVVRCIPVRNDAGEIIRWFGAATDIEELKQAQARVAERETWFRTLFDTIPVSAAVIEVESLKFLQFNDAAAKNLGYTREEFRELTVFDIDTNYSPDDLRQDLEQGRYGTGKLVVLERQHRTKTGAERDVIVFVRVLTLDGRRVSYCIWQDVTEKKAAEAALIQSETWFRALFDTIPLSVVLIDPHSRKLLQFNEAAAKTLEYTREEFAKLRIDDIDAVHTPEQLDRHFAARLRAGGFGAYGRRHRTKSGAIRDVEVYSNFLTMGGRAVANSVWQDVTEEKAAEAALRDSERRAQEQQALFRGLFDTIPLSAALINLGTHRFVQFNDAAARNLGYSREEFAQLKVWDIDAVHSQQEFEKGKPVKLKEIPESGSGAFETKHRTKDGSLRDVIVHARYMMVDGIPLANCVWEDITDKKAAEAALVESERRAKEQETLFRTLFETIPLSAALIDLESLRFLQFNDLAAKNLGYSRPEFAQLTLFDVEGVWRPEELRQHVIGRSYRDSAVLETKHRTKSGDLRDVVVYDHHLTLDGRRVANCVWQDVTEKKAAQAALVRGEKLASAGRMAATVAHEINNPLEAATNCVYLAAGDPNLPPHLKEYLAIAERELHRVAHIAKRTLGFYQETTKPEAVDVAALVDEVAELYDPKLTGKHIRLRLEHDGRCAGTVAIAGEIRQVISNLLTNAIDATPSGGVITVRTRQVSLSHGSYARVTIADTGTGISAVNLRRIFEPFFTAKKEVGTGLGLWVSREIIQKHRGRIRVRSIEAKGSVFSVFLPIRGSHAH